MASPLVLGAMAKIGQSIASSGASSFGSGAGSGLSDAIFGGISARRQWRYQQKQMKLQQQYALEQMAKSAEYQLLHDKEMFDYQNAYNDPSKVFDRYLKAGVTPAGVLGSSGVGVSATVPTSSGGAPSGSGPSGGAPIGGPLGRIAGDPMAIAQIGVAESTQERNRAAATLDRADAERISNQTQSKDYYASMAALNESIARSNVDNAAAVADMNSSLARIYQADADVAQTLVGYKIQDFIAQYTQHKEEADRMRRYNVEYFDRVMDAQIALDAARAFEASESGGALAANSRLTRIRVADAENWFDVNWDIEIDVPRYDIDGKFIRTEKYTGKQIAAELRALDFSVVEFEKGKSRWQVRSEKNRLGYDMLKVFSGAVGAAAGSAMTRNAGGPVHMSSETSTEHYDRYGEFIGGTNVRRSEVRGRNRRK